MTHKTKGSVPASAKATLRGEQLSPEKEQQLVDLWAKQARGRGAWWDDHRRCQARGREETVGVPLTESV
jgi:hypothetical protein